DNPWTMNSKDIQDNATVFIAGTGPTMVDVVLTLYHQKHQGKIIAVSRHGLLPATHALCEEYPDFSQDLKGMTSLPEIVKVVRRHIAISEKRGIGWRAVIDAMRPFTQELWFNIPVDEKNKFLKFYKSYWEVARSRMPEQCAAIMSEMKLKGQL